MGSRTCSLCNGPSRPCLRCGARSEHRHLAILNRQGEMTAQAPVCASCAATFYVGGLAKGLRLTDALRAAKVAP